MSQSLNFGCRRRPASTPAPAHGLIGLCVAAWSSVVTGSKSRESGSGSRETSGAEDTRAGQKERRRTPAVIVQSVSLQCRLRALSAPVPAPVVIGLLPGGSNGDVDVAERAITRLLAPEGAAVCTRWALASPSRAREPCFLSAQGNARSSRCKARTSVANAELCCPAARRDLLPLHLPAA